MNGTATVIERAEQVEVTKPLATAGVDTQVTDKEAGGKAYDQWLEQRKQETHAQQARKLAGSFLRRIEGRGYHGYVIIGIPNEVIHGSKLETHLENCEDCDDDGDLCDEGFEASIADASHDNIFVLKSAGVGESDDYSDLEYELSDEGRSRVYDLLCDAETVSTEPALQSPGDIVPAANGPTRVYTAEFWKTAYALIDSPQRCEQCKLHATAIPPRVNVRLVLTGDGTPKVERLHLLCTRCHPDPKEKVEHETL
jgi:hypothetical protein